MKSSKNDWNVGFFPFLTPHDKPFPVILLRGCHSPETYTHLARVPVESDLVRVGENSPRCQFSFCSAVKIKGMNENACGVIIRGLGALGLRALHRGSWFSWSERILHVAWPLVSPYIDSSIPVFFLIGHVSCYRFESGVSHLNGTMERRGINNLVSTGS